MREESDELVKTFQEKEPGAEELGGEAEIYTA
jgi:hypothetical protein